MQTGASALSFRVFIQIVQADNTETSARNPGLLLISGLAIRAQYNLVPEVSALIMPTEGS
jgi:hypothetical protein